MIKLRRLHDSVQLVIPAAGDGDTGNVSVVIFDRTEKEIAGEAKQTQIGAAPALRQQPPLYNLLW